MKPLYLSHPVRKGLGSCLRPGGEALTRHIIGLLDPEPGDLILDSGCGMGASMRLLHEEGCHRVIGLDLDAGLLRGARQGGNGVGRADLAALPVLSGTVDTVLCECVWNLTDKQCVLHEFARVIRYGGILVLSDIYLRATPEDSNKNSWPRRSCFFQATDLQTVQEMVIAAGFAIQVLEDHSGLLKQTAAEFVFAHGSLQGFWQAVLGDGARAEAVCTMAKATRPGLFLLMARRRRE